MGQMLLMIDGTRNKLLPYLRQNKRHHGPSNDRWSQEQKCKKKIYNIKIYLAWKILRDLYRSLLTGKLHSQKEIFLCFKAVSSSTCLVFASSHGFSTLPSKATVRESSPSFLQSTNYESIIVILSVTCIVPKYHIVFCMIVMFLTLSS